MSKVIRFGVSIEEGLVNKFDDYIKEKKYTNRSEAIRDLIRQAFVEEEWDASDEVAGGISIVYNHHKRELVNKLIDIQHDFHGLIISTQHIHLNHDNCLEFIVVKGSAEMAKKLYNILRSTKGVIHTGIVKATTGKKIE